ncbi:MAG: 3-isopropylmalate dehydratase large subunit [Saprospiraceae bacterium]|nr:3-isopropylmalate dehydratase large subunit [Saprospiraceae bacterium]
MAQTVFDRIWDAHVVTSTDSGSDVLYIDRHFVHEVTSPQAFDTLTDKSIGVRRVDRTTATADHNVPTINQHLPIRETLSREQVAVLERNCEDFGVEFYGLLHHNQGIVHVIGPELGLTQPGMTIVCGDSHTSTHGAFGCIAFGIGTSQVAQVLATQCVLMQRPKTIRITVTGTRAPGVQAKDVILHIIARLGTGGATGHFVEYAGDTIEALSMEERMTICNMSIEMGARGGLIAPDQTTYAYLRQRPFAPKQDWDRAVAYWQSLRSGPDARFDREYNFDAAEIGPMITYGTNPGMGMKVTGRIPQPNGTAGDSFHKSLEYMGLKPGMSLLGHRIDHVFIGSCTNARIEDLRAAAAFVNGKKKAAHVRAMVIPGSMRVRKQAVEEGLQSIFENAGFEFREPGCSACLGMNEDKVPAGAYCVSTSNRNFEGRQGRGARTILASPLTAAASAIAGCIVDVREMI